MCIYMCVCVCVCMYFLYYSYFFLIQLLNENCLLPEEHELQLLLKVLILFLTFNLPSVHQKPKIPYPTRFTSLLNLHSP